MTITTTEARTALSQILARFREEGLGAEPVIFGDHRKPEGVVISYELFARLESAVEQALFEASEAMTRSETVLSDPSGAVQVSRRRRRS